MSFHVHLTQDLDGGTCLYAPYKDFEPVREEFKRRIPYGARQWDPARRTWKIDRAYAHVLMHLLTQWQCAVTDDRPPPAAAPPWGHAPAAPAPPEPPSSGMPEDLAEALALFMLAPTATLEAAEALYRHFVKQHHPDHGGDPDTFRRWSLAMDTIRRYAKGFTSDDDLPF